MEIKATKYIYDYDGRWADCKVEEIWTDDFLLYVDGKQVEVGRFIKILLEKLGEIK